MGYRKREHVGSGGQVTPEAVRIYREGVACTGQARRFERYALSRQLRAELGADVLLPCLLEREPVFLLAVMDEAPYRRQWAELKAELEEAAHE